MPIQTQPPFANGIMSFSIPTQEDGTANPSYDAAKVKAVTDKLNQIISAFVATDDQPSADTFYVVSTYNKANVGSEINGDTAQYLLTPTGV